MKALQQLIFPYKVNQFLTEFWTQKALYIPTQDQQKFKSLFSWNDLNNLLNYHQLSNSDLRFSLNGESCKATDDPQAWSEYLRQGATLIVNGVHRRVPAVTQLAADLRHDIGYRAHVNLYLSPTTTQGFDCHYDNHDVLILQIDGEKEWFVFSETIPHPVLRHSSNLPQPTTPPYVQQILKPGDVLYIPRGHWHYAIGCGQASLHLTIGIDCQTGLDWLRWLTDELQEQVDWRQSLNVVVNGDVNPLESQLEGLQNKLIEYLSKPEVLQKYISHLKGLDLPRFQVNLPAQIGVDIFPEAFQTRFAWSPLHRIWVKQIEEEHYEVKIGTKQIDLKGVPAVFVENLFNRAEFSLMDLADWAPDLDFDGDIAPLLTRSVMEGVLQVKTD